ncbi:MAG: hypothetical protein ACI8XB_000445 [Patiriisocius sp.]|jgi:hypothetical protein
MRNSFLGILVLAFITMSCEKPESKIGLELLPDEENLGFALDSTTVKLRTTLHDSLRTDRLNYYVLGDMTDLAITDRIQANIYFQLRLSALNVVFGDSAVVDSMVLSLDFQGDYYGELTAMNFTVQQLSESLSLDSTYYSYSNLAVMDTNLLGDMTYTVTPDLETDVVVGEDTLAPHIRLKLASEMSNNLGQTFLDADASVFETSTSFLEYFKGLKLTASNPTPSSGGGLIYLDLIESPLSKMTLYYHLPNLDSLSFDFDISASSQVFTEFSHMYGLDVIDQLEDMEDLGTVDYEEVYIQSTAGLGVDVILPNLLNFGAEENFIINRAVLELPVNTVDAEMFEPCAEIKAVMMVDGEEQNIPDAVLSGSGVDYVGGIYDEENNVYKITLTRFVEQVLNGQIEEPIFTIVPSLSRTVANRSIIDVGDETEDRRAKLIINYTTY